MSSQAVWADPAANQLPAGGSVAAGTVSISTSGSKMQIDQASDKAIINWQNFSIGSSGWVNFSQPSASSVALNRSMQPAEIFGRLSANGQVFVTSSAGVYFGRTAQVDVGGLVASNLSIRDQDFMAGRYVFSNEGSSGSVVNDGTIITPAGYAALAGTQVRNNGVIVAQAGTVALAAGDRVTLDMVGDGLIKVSVDAMALNALALNAGTIQADGGRVVLTARSANALLDTVINNTGAIRARSLVERNGEIVLDGGSAGVVANSGTLDASGSAAGTTGGSVQVTGQYVALTEGSTIDASGDAGGGTVTVKATDAAFIYGAISARDTGGNGKGGTVETSGRYLEVTQAPDVGAGGTWLLDPYNMDVVADVPPPGFSNNTGPTTFTPSGDSSQIAAGLITNQLNAGTNVILDTGGAGSPGTQVGDIRVLAAIDKTVANPASLTLKAFHDVQITQPITIASAFGPTGFGTLTVEAGNDVVVSAPINLPGGGFNVRAGGFTNLSAINNGVSGDLKPGMAIFADRFDLAGGTINGGLGSVGLFTRTTTNTLGVESAGDTRITNADIASITTGPDSPLTNANQLLIGVGSGGTMRIGDDAQVNGGSKNLVFSGGFGPGTRITVGANGVTTTGDVVLDGSGGSIAGTGAIGGNRVVLRASTGIGASDARVTTAANTLAVNTGGNAFVSEADNVMLDNVVTMGTTFTNSVGGAYDFAANGSVTVRAPVFSASAMNVNVAGDLDLIASPGRAASLFTNGAQTITAANLSLQGALAGNNGGASISNGAGGSQQINVAGGTIRLVGGAGGQSNTALIFSNGNQTIDGNPDITITAGSEGVANLGNTAGISTAAGRTQVIRAGTLELTSGASGIDATAFITGGVQDISTTGDLRVTGGGSGGTRGAALIGGPGGGAVLQSTILTLNVGRDLVLTGGSALNDSASIGSSGIGVGTPTNDITIVAARDVVLNSGTGAGARIGTSLLMAPTDGHISVTAGRNIELNGTAQSTVIRTAGSVVLHANGGISEAANGSITARELTTSSGASTSLVGPNQVSSFNAWSGGNLSLVNTGALTVSALSANGDATLSNTGDVTLSGPWNSLAASIATVGAGSDLMINNSMTSSGTMNLDVAGNLSVSASGVQDAFVHSFGGQTITARALEVSARDGRSASLWNTGPSAQTIAASNGAGVDVVAPSGGGIAQILADAGSSQSVTVVNGDHINVNGATGQASIIAFNTSQTLSITGSGANAITMGSGGATGSSIAHGSRDQSVTAGNPGEAGSITITGPGVNNALAGLYDNPNLGGTQTISTAGLISITGGTAPSQPSNFFTGIAHNGSGQQQITAAGITMTGGSSGNGNTATIGSFGGGVAANAGAQLIDVGGGNISLAGGAGGNANTALINALRDQTIASEGTISVHGGAVGNGNRAGIVAGGNQTIDGNPDIIVIGGSSGGVAGNGNNAFINTNGGVGTQQTINASSIELRSGSGGTDNSASMGARKQVITVSGGDVRLIGGASAGTFGGVRLGGLGGATLTSTDLTLTLNGGGNLTLTGGSVATNTVSIGSGVGTAPLSNNIHINAGGNVVLDPGSAAARIGNHVSAPASDGDISINAASIQLNGAGATPAYIRTGGNVTLSTSGTISEGSNGFIMAHELSTSSGDAQALVGPNQVSRFTAEAASGDVTLRNSASVLTLGTMDLSGSLAIDQTGALAVPGTVTALNQSIGTTGDVLIGSASGAAAAGLFAPGTISITTPGSIVLRGSDVANGGTSMVSAGGLVTVNAGELHLTGGAAPLAAASVLGGELVVTSAQNITLTSGSGFNSNALLYSRGDITMTIGGILTIDGGHSLDNWARVQTEQYDGRITLNFPNASSGGFSVDGFVGKIKHGQDGLFTADKPAKLGDTLFINYGL